MMCVPTPRERATQGRSLHGLRAGLLG